MSDDSLQNRKVFPEVVKEAIKTNIKGKMFIPISEIGDSLLLQMRPQQVDEILTMLPSLFIQNYGGFGGMKSISIRGTSSSQSVLMIEGIRMNSTQNGMLDVSTIPASMLESIEVTRTGSSALYGANAIGGAINFRLQNSTVQKPSIILDRSSFDTYTATTSFGFTLGEVTTNISVNGISSRGNYPFQHNEFGTTTTKQRDNGDFQQYSGMISSTYSPSLTTSISGLYLSTATERGVPGAVVQGSIEFKNARLQENNHFVTLIGKTLLFPSLQNDSKLWFRNNTFLYTDPDATLLGVNGLTAKYTSMDIGLQSAFTQSLGNSTLESQIEMISNTLEGFSLEDGETIKPYRNTISLSSNYTSPILNLFSVPLQFFTGLRYDYISDQKNALSPLISLHIPFSENVKVRTSYSYNYRPPSFNEMYYLNYGNQNLVSERSHSTTVGIDANVTSFFDILQIL
jgi:outer membrane receptor protein involved in Fe transport